MKSSFRHGETPFLGLRDGAGRAHPGITGAVANENGVGYRRFHGFGFYSRADEMC
jgi:hypothetical protein